MDNLLYNFIFKTQILLLLYVFDILIQITITI